MIRTGSNGAATRRRRGSSMVELAIVLPLLFSVFFAIAEFSIPTAIWARKGAS